jgi:phage tail protein X
MATLPINALEGAIIQIPRFAAGASVLGTGIGAAMLAMTPSPLGSSEVTPWDQPSKNPANQGFNNGVEAIQSGDHGGYVLLNGKSDPYVPTKGVPFQGSVGSRGNLPSIDASIPQLVGIPVAQGGDYLIDYEGYGEEADNYPDLLPPLTPGQDRLGWSNDVFSGSRNSGYTSDAARAAMGKNVYTSASRLKVAGILPRRLAMHLPDLSPVRAEHLDLPDIPQQTWTHPSVLLRIDQTVDGTRVRVDRKWVRDEQMQRKRKKDTKAQSRSLIARLNRIVTMSYGLATELHDAVEVMAWSMYAKVDGRIVPAMAVEHMSIAGVFQGYLEGDYKLDTVGFAQDFVSNQISDIAYAMPSHFQNKAAIYLAGDAGYKANKLISSRAMPQSDAQKEASDVYSELIRSAQGYYRSFDVQRKARTRALWEPRPRS